VDHGVLPLGEQAEDRAGQNIKLKLLQAKFMMKFG